MSPSLAKPTVLAVLPGNPGDAVFYGEFVQALRALGHEVTVTSHLATSSRQRELLPYARHQVEAIGRYLGATGRSVADVELVLLGHSVGAYLAYLIAARGLAPVARAFLLFPFLSRPARSGRVILKLVTSPRLMAAGLWIWRVLPRWLQRPLIVAAGAGAHGDWVQAAMAAGQPQAWSAMAGAEAIEIASRPDASYLAGEPLFQHPARVTCLLCRGDRWAPRGGTPSVVDTEVVDGVSHAFVVDRAQCDVVARLVHERLTRGGKLKRC